MLQQLLFPQLCLDIPLAAPLDMHRNMLACRLMGVELVCTYVLIALLYLFIKETPGVPAA